MEDISNKRASMVSVPSSQNMAAGVSGSGVAANKGTGPVTPVSAKVSAAEAKLKRQSTAENSSPLSRSRKGSSCEQKVT